MSVSFCIFNSDMNKLTSSQLIFLRYLLSIGVGTTILFVGVISLNYMMDPYSVYNTPKIDGVNANKPELFKHLRLTKAHIIGRRRPDALVIGSSRTEHGLDPEHPALSSRYNAYNLALTGATIYENLRYIQHANEINSLKFVVLAIDFFQFNAYRPNSPDFSEKRLAANTHGETNYVSPLTDLASTLASFDTLMASLSTFFEQENRDNVILPRGQVEQPDVNSVVILKKGRHEAALYSELNYISHLYFPRPHKKFDFVSEDGQVNTFDYFRRIIEDCHRQRIKLKILISPAHARQWQLIASAGLWGQWETWKREVVRINEEVARWHKKKPFSLWDFSGYNSYTTETVPKLGDNKTMMQWYWESSHYRKELGDLVLDRVMNYSDPQRKIADDFGFLLTSKNITSHLLATHKGRQSYEMEHPDEVREIDELVKKYQSN